MYWWRQESIGRSRAGLVGDEFELANHHRLILSRRLLEAPQIDTYLGRDVGNIRCIRGVGFGLDHIGNCSERLSAVHQREYDVVREPLHSRGRQSSTADVKVVLPSGNSLGFVMSGGRVNSEIGIARLAGLVPLRKFDVDFVFCVRADMVNGAVGK